MAKSSNIYARIEPDVKEQAESILETLGIPVSNAINVFYKQIILHRGIPFELKIPQIIPMGVHALTKDQLDAELNIGFVDMEEGRTKAADEVFADIRKSYKL